VESKSSDRWAKGSQKKGTPAEKPARWGVLLLAHGAPSSAADIPEFLLNVRGGRPLAQEAAEEIIHRYEQIGGSPLLERTERQAEVLAEALSRRRLEQEDPEAREDPIPVCIGMRNWRPFIADAVERLRGDGVKRVLALCLAPHNSRTSVGLYRQHLDQAVEKFAPGIEVEFVSSWHDRPELIEAFREKISKALDDAARAARRAVPVILTAHSVPARTIAAGDPYESQVNETARLVAEASSLLNWRLAFQSQGMSPEPWIGPSVESQIDAVAAEGHRHVLIAPVGFVSDNIEILYDVDVIFREYARQRGLTLWRSESLNDSPTFIRALHAIVVSRIWGPPGGQPRVRSGGPSSEKSEAAATENRRS